MLFGPLSSLIPVTFDWIGEMMHLQEATLTTKKKPKYCMLQIGSGNYRKFLLQVSLVVLQVR